MSSDLVDDQDFYYRCATPFDSCAATCVSLEACQACECAVIQTDAGGPWGDVMDVFFCLSPILFLIYVTVKSNPLPTTVSLPVAAVLMMVVRLAYLEGDPLLTVASVVLGWHEAFTPLSIMGGAILLFETMESTLCLPYMMREIKILTAGHAVAEVMLIFAFGYLVEGASGFGTPVALGAPMLVSTGHDAMQSVVALLIFNTLATVWGAVGTPLWFGFGTLGLTEDELLSISQKAAAALACSGIVLVPATLSLLVPMEDVRNNIRFVMFCFIATVGPSAVLATVNYEFASLLGGICGCILIALAIQYKIGMHPMSKKGKRQRNNNNNAATASATHQSQSQSHQQSQGDDAQIKEDEEEYEEDPDGATRVSHDSSVMMEHALEMGAVPQLFRSQQQQRQGTPASMIQEESDEEGLFDEDVNYQDNRNHNNNHHITATANSNRMAKAEDEDEVPSSHHSSEGLGPRKTMAEGYLWDTLGRTFPLWGVVLLLILTRVEQIGVKELLTKREPNVSAQLGTWGRFQLSSSLVVQLNNILTYPGLNWKYELLYVPFLVPFVLVSVVTMMLYRKDMVKTPVGIFQTVASRLTNPFIALLGALALVQLMIRFDTMAPAYILGTVLAEWFQEGFVVICPLLGALGSFFSGSTTVSNLTFGGIQLIAAKSIGVSKTTMLALQSVGGSAGNGICLNNIIAACTVVGLDVGEGKILMQTYKFVLLNTTIATIVMLATFYRF